MNVFSQSELEKVAQDELGEDKAHIKSDLQTLKDWISKTPHLKGIRQDDAHLLKFLRGCKFSLERSKEKLDLYNACRSNVPQWFGNWDVESPLFQKFLGWGNYLPLPGYDKHGRQVILMRTGQIVPSQTNIEEVLMTSLAFYELACEDNTQGQVKGIVVLNDLGQATAQHAIMFNPVMAKKGITIWQEAYPARPKAMHFLNFPPVVQGVFTMMQGFLNEKMKKRNQVHQKGDYTKLLEDVGAEVLPEEYGGSNGSVEEIQKAWVSKVMANKDWYKEQTKYKSDESKRPGKPKSHADIFGIEGSFRKLEID
eukprot:TRINITY_DN47040_c0_g1_i1.p1 TRINITY_DN47040_c0_g1~~TRINITY_DN47040_c0_g1_i1.p1  ORF type:complete len:319 (+),score=84.77 TRINITY_DN47040_c0_g1_i1:28-957(+)